MSAQEQMDGDVSDCLFLDEWSRRCIHLPLDVKVASGLALCGSAALNVLLWTLYCACLRYTHRPLSRFLWASLITGGLVLKLVQAVREMAKPEEIQTDDLSLWWIFILGDVLDHAGVMLLIYGDICQEAIHLIYAMEPGQGLKTQSRFWKAGVASMASQPVILIPFLLSMHFLDDVETRRIVVSIFVFVQLAVAFGVIPSIAFSMLASGVQALRAKLPKAIPKSLLHRLRYTRWALYFLALFCFSLIVGSALLALVPVLHNTVGLLYVGVICLSISLVGNLLLGLEVVLTWRQLRHIAIQAMHLEADVLEQILKVGVHFLSKSQPWSSEESHLSYHSADYAPVWNRGIAYDVAKGFGDHVEDEESTLTTTDVCMKKLKPMTEPARCSAWEGLRHGFQHSQDKHLSAKCHHYVGPPTVFVSHCWSCSYWELLMIMKRYDENDNRRNLFFLDIFSMNQHDFADLTSLPVGKNFSCESPKSLCSEEIYGTMLTALTRSIEKPGRVLLALTPHQQPKLLTRSWCLYEIYIAWKVDAEVSCGFIPEAELSVKESLLESDALINEMLSSVDAEKSRATVESDREMILSMIQKAGVDLFNSFVREKLFASLRLVAMTTLLHDLPVQPRTKSSHSTASVETRSGVVRQSFRKSSSDLVECDDYFGI